MVPLYIAAVTAAMLASAVWRYRQRDTIGMAACLLMAALAGTALLLPSRGTDAPAIHITRIG